MVNSMVLKKIYKNKISRYPEEKLKKTKWIVITCFVSYLEIINPLK